MQLLQLMQIIATISLGAINGVVDIRYLCEDNPELYGWVCTKDDYTNALIAYKIPKVIRGTKLLHLMRSTNIIRTFECK